MKLYWGSGSDVSWRVQMALALKGLEYESHRLDLASREHRGEAYRAINPRGTFPVLVDGGVTVRDSIAILAYLESRFPVPALFGRTPARVAGIWQLVAEHDSTFGARTATITRALFRDAGLADPGPVREAVEAVHADLGALEARTRGDAWLADETPSAAEAVCYPTLQRLLRADARPAAAQVGLSLAPLSGTYPALAAWLSRVASLPGVDATFPPHWREG